MRNSTYSGTNGLTMILVTGVELAARYSTESRWSANHLRGGVKSVYPLLDR